MSLRRTPHLRNLDHSIVQQKTGIPEDSRFFIWIRWDHILKSDISLKLKLLI